MTDSTDSAATAIRQAHLYCRVSTAEQSREGFSLGEQERQCRAIAANFYPDREMVLWVEPGVSAAVPLAKRKAGAQMVAALRAGDVLIASKLDRVFRNLIDALTQIEDFVAREVDCVLLDIGTDPISGTGAGRLQFQLLSAMGEFERTRLRERLADSLAARRAKGMPLGGNARIGSRIEGEGRDRRLVPDLREQEMLAEMRRLRQQGCSFASIADEIANRGFRNRKDNKIDSAQIRRLLLREQPEMGRSRSEQIKAAIARKRDNGWTPGNPKLAEARQRGTAALMRFRVERYHRIEPIIRHLVKEGYTSYRTIAIMLNAAKTPTLGRAKEWYPASVRKVMQRLGIHSPYPPGRPRKPRNGAAPPHAEPGPRPPPTPLNTSLRRWHKKRAVQILALRDEGLSVAEIAARLQLGDDNTVRRVLREAGLSLGLKCAAAKTDEILNLRQAGRPVREIAEKTGLNARTIYRFLAAQGQRITEGGTGVSADDILPLIWNLQASGVKRKAVAAEFNRRQIPGPNGQPWTYWAVEKFMKQHQQSSVGLRQHKTAAEAVAVLPLIRQLQMDGCDSREIASRLQGTGRMWGKAGVEAVIGYAGEALAKLPAVVNTGVASTDVAAVEEASQPPSDEHPTAVVFARRHDEAWLAKHVWPAIVSLRAAGYKTAAAISRQLNTRGILPLDGSSWTTPEIHSFLKGSAPAATAPAPPSVNRQPRI